MKNIISDIEPKGVMKYFEQLSAVPRGSGRTRAAAQFCINFAKEHNLEYYTDETGNVVIYKNASPGCENKDPVIIQGHLDMVWEKAPGVDFDFETQGLELAVDGDYINAQGTTLGGDDGIAVAMALAVLEDDSIKHPPIEAVFTVDEETGMDGATALDASVLKGRRMLNIDSEEEGTLLVSCAGGARADVVFEGKTEYASGDACTVRITGLHGGHSGTDINKGYLSANKLMGEVLGALFEKNNIRLCSINGGTVDNAITRECTAVVTTHDRFALGYETEKLKREFRQKYVETEPDLSLTWAQSDRPAESFDSDSTRSVIRLLKELPQGVVSMSKKVEGMVETSLNMGVVNTNGHTVTFVFSVRSSVNSKKEELIESVRRTAAAHGAAVRTHSFYPAWEFVENSPTQKVMTEVYEKQTGKKMNVTSIHAGLECGIFCGKIKGLDCVSFGPDILDIHTPQERLSISSVQRVWKYLTAVLEELSVPETKPADPQSKIKTDKAGQTDSEKRISEDRRLFIILFSFLVISSVVFILISTGKIRIPGMYSSYIEAVNLIKQDEYEKAYDVLSKYESSDLYDYKDAYGLYKLCESHLEYDNNEIEDAWLDYNSYKWNHYFHGYQADISKQNEEYGRRLQKDYEPVSIKNEEISKKKEELSRRKEEEEYSRKVRYGVPFVGMSEKDIGNTTLGKPSDKVRHNDDYSGGKRTKANLYDFCNYYGRVIFTARCVNGVVKEVFDKRKEALANPYPTKKPTNPTTAKKYDSDVDEFGDAEDYYDWYYDDYYDFEDAEEYFDEYY